MLKRFFAILLCFQFAACANPNSKNLSVARETAAAGDGIARFCSKLLAREEYQFKFDDFCAAREKYDGQTIVVAHFVDWRKMSAEELMALIELHTQQVYRLKKGLDREQLNARKRVRLLTKIAQLQKSERNVHRRVEKLMGFWYEMTHAENLKLTFKTNPLVIKNFFSKVREQNKLDRLQGELVSRNMIQVLTEAGMIDDPTWWGTEKRNLRRDYNIVQGVVALALSAPSLVTSGFPLVIAPEFDFDSARKLADEYQSVVAEKGHEEAMKIVLEKSRPRTTKNSYYRVIARYANIAMFAAAISWTAYDHSVQKHQAYDIVQKAIETPADKREAPVKLKSYADEFAEDAIRDLEERGEKLTPAQKAEIYKMYRDNAAAIASKTTPKPE